MTTISASCPACGKVELSPRQVRLVASNVPARSWYGFTCPTCLDEVRKSADADVVAALTSGGVPAEPLIIPAEALEEHRGPAITADDVLDFALWLATVDLPAAVAGVATVVAAEAHLREGGTR